MTIDKQRVGLLPVGDVATPISKAIAARLSACLKSTVDILPRRELPSEALDGQRRQYNAALLLKRFAEDASAAGAKIIAVVDVDLFVPLFTHVLGEAEQNGPTGIVSLFRLRENRSPAGGLLDGVFLERASKVALHEIGHLFNLWHCQDTRCLMRFSSNVSELDRMSMCFCRYCSVFLRDSLPAEDPY
jgi:archaemetzincin